MTRYQQFLAVVFAAAWIISALNPPDREGWLLENILVFIFVPIVIISGRYFQLSSVSYTLITIFMLLHVVGSHWTYADVPFGFTLGHWMGTDRNMYDRLVHFSFGLLLVYPIREVFLRLTGAKGAWGYYFPFDVVMSFSALYEIMEWIVGMVVSPTSGITFLGAQGDYWDTQKDMACAAVGALIAMAVVVAVNWYLDRQFWAEIRESLRIKREKPLGEDGLAELLESGTQRI
jgi:putative membrane protein